MTPFQKAGYTKGTKFRVSVNDGDLREGDIVTLYVDDGSASPKFITEDGKQGYLRLPGTTLDWEEDDIEVYSLTSEDKLTEVMESIQNLIKYSRDTDQPLEMYEVVESLPSDVLDKLECAIYAYNANMDAKTDNGLY